jgi:hypothetical protein
MCRPAERAPGGVPIGGIVRVMNGRIVEHWGLIDTLTFLRQIEQVPES